jgi:hypothetical protein
LLQLLTAAFGTERRFAATPQYVRSRRQTGLVTNGLETSRALVREGWGSDQDAYREFFTSQFIPAGTIEHHRWLNDIQRIAAAPESAEQVLCTIDGINVVDLLPTVHVPTLVMHDLRQPFSLGQEIAAGIPGAKFVPLEGRNHVILAVRAG